ncbi:capsid protein [Halyomorpha halys orthomyxo-like virus 1]|nr:capsid protein [Halyomorpha halys orthomyxo-like virus 1]WJE88692.1 MAG: nucleocapsid protein [Halyomorpha halys orthomyxo-like virus 1]
MATVQNKRKRQNAEGGDYQGPKRQRIELNKTLREKVLSSILYAHIRLAKEINDEWLDDITLSEQVTAALLNAHNCLRQAANSSGGLGLKVKDATFTYEKADGSVTTVTVTKARIENILTMCLQLNSLQYQKGQEWIGIASPMFAFMVGFKARRQELRVGTSDLPISKSTSGGVTETKTVPVAEYGMSQAHCVLLEGITYQPNLKSMMAQSVGPMTSLIMLSRTSSGMFSNKWEEAVLRDFMNFPDIHHCIALIKGNSVATVRPLMRVMADILLITGSRAANRMFYPGYCLVHVLLDPATVTSIYGREETGGNLGNVRTSLGDTAWTNTLSFSGFYGFQIYQKLAEKTWRIKTTRESTSDMLQQIFFHSVFGTFKEDFGILKWMTEGSPTFLNRKQMDCAFGPSVVTKNFKPYKLKRWSKMASAQQTDFLGTSSSQVVAQSSFSGKRTRNWGEDFFKHLDSEAVTRGFTGSRNVPGLTGQYSNLLSSLQKQLAARGNKTTVGTVSWYTFETDMEGGCRVEESVPVETGSFFIDNRD